MKLLSEFASMPCMPSALTPIVQERAQPYLQGAGQKVVLGDDVHKEIRRDFIQLVIQDEDEIGIKLLILCNGLFRTAQDI